jgi:sirohydrochlorin ferrochelatase
MRTAIVLIAHGSRRAEANAELLQLAQQVRAARPDCIVGHAFLELAEPSIPSAVQACIAQGAERVQLFPYFLSSGVHVTRDIEEFRRTFAAEHPGVEFRVSPPLGAHAGVASLVLELLSDAGESTNPATDANAGGKRQS